MLLTGGCTAPGCGGFEQGRRSELFDPLQRAFSVGPLMLQPTASGTATLLKDGRVLLTGGYPGEGQPATNSTQLYDPRANHFVPGGMMTTARADQTATVMADGRVLIAGGVDGSGVALATTELYDPQTGRFAAGPRMSQPRAGQTATLVEDQVVLIGGTESGSALATTDVLTDGTWAPGPDLLTPRVKLGAAVLSAQRVLVVGGASSTEGREKLASTEILSLRTGRSTYGPGLSEGEYKLDGAVVPLDDGRVAIAGGDVVDIYDPRSNEITALRRPHMGRRSFVTASPVGGNSLLVVGGYDNAIVPTDSAWLISTGKPATAS